MLTSRREVHHLLGALLLMVMSLPAFAGDDEQAIRSLDAQWVKAIAEKDATWIGNLYAPDGRLMPPNAPMVQGREAIRDAWANMMNAAGFSLTFTPTEIHVAESGDLGYDVGTYEGANDDHGKYVVVWKKIDGDWKVAADIFNSDGQ